MSYVYNRFREARTIITETLASTTASTASTLNSTSPMTATIACTVGDIWINPLVTATTANGFKLTSGDSIDLVIPGSLSIISDSTTAKYQGIFWKE